MAPDEATAARNPLGPVGGYVVANIKLLREERRLAYTELSAELARIGRPIPVLGLSRIERGKRRVDVDDLVAIAIALRVNPSALLLPRRGNATDVAELTPREKHTLRTLWMWADGDAPLPRTPEGATWQDLADFLTHARPEHDALTPEALLERYSYTPPEADDGR